MFLDSLMTYSYASAGRRAQELGRPAGSPWSPELTSPLAEVTVRLDGGNRAAIYETQGGCGVLVPSWDMLPVGTHVTVRLFFPNDEVHVAKGIVRWLEDAPMRSRRVAPRMGIELYELTPAVRKAISAFRAYGH